MADIITLSEYKAIKSISGMEYDAQLLPIIDMANDFIPKYCNRDFGPALYTERNEGIVDHLGRHMFYVKNTPVTSVISVSLKYVGVTTPYAVPVNQIDLVPKSGYMYYAGTVYGQGMLRPEYAAEGYLYDITYSGGEAVPSAVKLAAITMVSDMYEYLARTSSMNISGVEQAKELTQVKIGDYSESYAQSSSLKDAQAGEILTKSVKDLLERYIAHNQSW